MSSAPGPSVHIRIHCLKQKHTDVLIGFDFFSLFCLGFLNQIFITEQSNDWYSILPNKGLARSYKLPKEFLTKIWYIPNQQTLGGVALAFFLATIWHILIYYLRSGTLNQRVWHVIATPSFSNQVSFSIRLQT